MLKISAVPIYLGKDWEDWYVVYRDLTDLADPSNDANGFIVTVTSNGYKEDVWLVTNERVYQNWDHNWTDEGWSPTHGPAHEPLTTITLRVAYDAESKSKAYALKFYWVKKDKAPDRILDAILSLNYGQL